MNLAIEKLWDERSSFLHFKGTVDYVDSWLFMSTPLPVLILLASYFAIIFRYGPQYMKNRPAYNLNRLLLVYNAVQVAASAYIVNLGITFISTYGLFQKECIAERPEAMLAITTGGHAYLLIKMTELLDTIFFTLRKKQNQVTFLHVYHHSCMVVCPWLFLKYEPSTTTVFLGTVNSFIHVVMYSYYALAAFPKLAKHLWWKKYVTALQLVQFVSVILQVVIHDSICDCRPSYFVVFTLMFNLILFVFLFGQFYVKSYGKPSLMYSKLNGSNVHFKISNGDKVNGFSSYISKCSD